MKFVAPLPIVLTLSLFFFSACSSTSTTSNETVAEDGQAPKPESLRKIIDSVETKILTVVDQHEGQEAQKTEKAEAQNEEKQNEMSEETAKSLFDMEINKEVSFWIEFFTVRDSERFQRYLNQGERYRDVVQTILEENDLPNELFYLGIIESGFVPHAKSRARAVGAWQFMKGTAKLYGLEMNSYVDERRDPIRSTESAARYLGDLYKMFNSWELAIASYNCGPGRILKAIKKGQTRDYWELVRMRLLPRETRNYLPQFIAAVIIGQNPEKFGLYDPAQSEAANFPSVEAVDVPSLVRLSDVSRLSGMSERDLKESNPHLIKGVTPPGSKTYELWIHKEKSALVASLQNELAQLSMKKSDRMLADIESSAPGEKPHSHRIRRGETLSKIAQVYGISIDYLKEINNLEGHSIHPGQTLRLSARSYQASPKGGHTYKVRSGDTLEKIAKRYDISIDNLKDINGLNNSRIYAKQKLIIPKSKITARGPARTVISYRVKMGDTLDKIAHKYELSVQDLKVLNRMQKSGLKVGQILNVPSLAQ